jgi:hypothetical protein
MEPNSPVTPWGAASTIVTVLTWLAAIWTALLILVTIPATDWSAPPIDGHVCTTVTVADDEDISEDAFGAPDANGNRTAPVRESVCKPEGRLSHPTLAHSLSNATFLPLGLAAIGLTLALRRVITRSRDEGPFSPEAVRLLRPLRWQAPFAVMAAVIVSWVLSGISADLIADASWQRWNFLYPPLGAFLAIASISAVCEFGARQRQDAYDRGVAQGSRQID